MHALTLAVAGIGVAAGGTAQAAGCDEPRAAWTVSSPAAQGLDPVVLDRAIHAYQDRRAYAVRVYRNGCLVGSDTGAGNRTTQFETWDITTSVLSLLAGRQMQLGLLAPEDPVGALLPQADAGHGSITVRSLLERTTGLAPEPDNTFVPDRLRRALTLPVSDALPPAGGDAPTARALLVGVLQRAAGEDLQLFAARELFAPLGITSFRWTRDRTGTTNDAFGLALRADDLARLAELLRREGRWRGRTLLHPAYVREALTPSRGNPCLGWLTWLNAKPGCSGSPLRLLPGLPADLWAWRGRYDQRVVVVPSLALVVVRYGTSGGDQRSLDDQARWEHGVLELLLQAVRDTTPGRTPPSAAAPPSTEQAYADDALAVSAPVAPLPAAGPRRTRAPQVTVARERAGRKRLVGVRVACPPVPAGACTGVARLEDLAAAPKRFAVPAGQARTVLLRLRRRPRAAREATVAVHAHDDAAGVVVRVPLRIRR